MLTTLVKNRKSAFIAQSCRCFYCDFPMWESDCSSFAQTHKISLRRAKQFQCTAEHLVARQDGGKDAAQNIVAACLWCNQTRHKRKLAKNPSDYRSFVRRRLTGNRQYHQVGNDVFCVVEIMGGKQSVATKLGVEEIEIEHWIDDHYVPTRYAEKIHELTGWSVWSIQVPPVGWG